MYIPRYKEYKYTRHIPSTLYETIHACSHPYMYSQLQLQLPGNKEEHAANFGSHAKPGHHQFTLYVNWFDVDFDMQQRGRRAAESLKIRMCMYCTKNEHYLKLYA